jgi:hypothetical protein
VKSAGIAKPVCSASAAVGQVGPYRPAVARLCALLAPGGTLYLSWRVVSETGRDDAGRLYTSVDSAAVLAALGSAQILHDETIVGDLSGKPVRTVVARARQPSRGGEARSWSPVEEQPG